MTKAGSTGKRSRMEPLHLEARPAKPIQNYSSDAGHGSGTFEHGQASAWRRALLGSVAAGAMWAGTYRRAYAGCTTDNTTVPGVTSVDCTGATSTTANGDHAVNAGVTGAAGLYGYTYTGHAQGGDGADGDAVFVTLQSGGTLSTTGDGAFGINAVSKGGAGGGAYSYLPRTASPTAASR